jgi:hypothetical protein
MVTEFVTGCISTRFNLNTPYLHKSASSVIISAYKGRSTFCSQKEVSKFDLIDLADNFDYYRFPGRLLLLS